MFAAIENITVNVSRLICYPKIEWVLQSKRLSNQINSGVIKVHEVETFEEARALVIPRVPFTEYVSTINPFDIIIRTA